MPTTKPPQYILDAMGGSYDESKYRWDPDTMSLVGADGSYYYGDTPDPSQGAQLVTDLSAFNASRGQEGVVKLAPGAQPHFGFGDSAEGYDAGLMPGSGIFASADPNEIADYKQHARTQVLQGVTKVAVLVGAAAAAAAASGGSGAAAGGGAKSAAAAPASGGGAGAASAATTGLELAPNGLMTGSMAAAGGGAGVMAGAVPAVGAGVSTVAPTVFSRVASFLRNNRDIIGSVLTGIGESIVQQNAQEDLLNQQRELISANYRGADPAKTYKPMAQNTQTQKPHERFAPSTAGQGGGRLRFDPLQGKIVRELMPTGN